MARYTKSSTAERAYDELVDEFSNLVTAVEEVFSAAAEGGSEKLSELKDHAEASLKTAKSRLEAVGKQAMLKGPKVASDSDVYVHENPWTAVGIGVGVGLLLGLLIGRGK